MGFGRENIHFGGKTYRSIFGVKTKSEPDITKIIHGFLI
jgi:hypothetical protein